MKRVSVIRRFVIAALPIGYFLGLALLWFRPLTAHLTDHLLSAPWWYDALLNAAQLETWSSNLMDRPGDLLEGLQFYPHNDVLGFTEQMPVLSLLARLARSFGATPVGAYNLVLLTGFFLNGWATFLFVKRVTGERAFALLAGTLLETAPYFIYQSGRLQLLWLSAFPLALSCVHCLAMGLRRHTAMMGLALAVAVTWGSCVYYAVLLTPLIAVVVLLYATSGLVFNRPVFLIRTGISMIIGLALMVQELLAYNRISTTFGFKRNIYVYESSALWKYLHLEPGKWIFWGSALAKTPGEGETVLFPGAVLLGIAAGLLITLIAFLLHRTAVWSRKLVHRRGKGLLVYPWSKILWTTLLVLVWTMALRMFVLTHDLSPPLLAILLTCLRPGSNDSKDPRIVALRALSVIAMAGFVLSLGPSIEVSKTTYTLPLTWLYDLLPGFNAVRFVSRWGIIAIAGTACLGAIFGAILFERHCRLRIWLPLTLAALTLVELWPHPFDLISIPNLIENSPANRFLRDHPGGTLAALPVRTAANRFTDGVCQDAILTYAAACFHHHPVVNGMSGFDPPFYEDVVLPVLEAFPHVESLQLLDVLGVRWVYVRGQFYEKSQFDDLVVFASAHPERFRLVSHQDMELVLERVGKIGIKRKAPPEKEVTIIKPLPGDCTMSTSIASADTRFLTDQNVGTIWSTRAPQHGNERINISCRQPMAIGGFVFELGGRYADYPRGLVIEHKNEDNNWVPLLAEDKAIDLSRLVFHPKINRVVKTFAPTQAATWRIRQIGTSVKNAWSVAEIEIIPAFMGLKKNTPDRPIRPGHVIWPDRLASMARGP